MSIVSSIQGKESPKDYIENINSIFNSKLFLYLDINDQDNQDEENEINNPDTNKNNENNIDEKEDFEEINYLSNELIKELNNCTVLTNENNDIKDENKININIINSLVSLAKNGYEFKPKNYKQNSDKIYNKSNNNNLNYNYKNKYSRFKNNKKKLAKGF